MSEIQFIFLNHIIIIIIIIIIFIRPSDNSVY